LGGGKLLKALCHFVCLAAMPADGALQAERFQIVHVAWAHAKAPKRGGAKLVCGVRGTALNDAIARPDIVEQKVAVGMNDLVAQSIRNRESAAIDDRACRNGDEGGEVTSGAAEPGKQSLPGQSVRFDARAASCGGTSVPRMNCAK
jgi:hypothetical protein